MSSDYSPQGLRELFVKEEATLWDAMLAIDRGAVEIAFVVDENESVVGTVTDGDVRRALLSGTGFDGPVRESMSRSFQSVTRDGNHRALAMEAMVAFGVKQIPVLDEDGRLAGLHVINEFVNPEPLTNWAVVLAGGKGTRLRPITEHIPKPMVTVAGRPILERLILGLVGEGFRKVFLSVNYKREIVRDHFGDGSAHGCEIDYLEESMPLSTGGPLSLLPEKPADAVLLLNGDLVGDLPFRTLLEFHEQSNCGLTVGVGLHRHVVPFGVVRREGNRVVEIEEKPTSHWWINQGVYAISPEVVSMVPRDVEYPVTDLIQACIDASLPVGAFEMDGDWYDVGRPEDLLAARGGQSGS